MSASNDSFGKTIGVAVGLCLLCSLAVSGAAVALKKDQQANKAADVQRSILLASGLLKEGEAGDVTALFANVETLIIDMESGEKVEGVDVAKFNQRKLAKTPGANKVLTKDEDIAKIKRRSKQAKVYLVRENGKLKSIVLPVHGYGLFSTLYGFIALEADTKTVVGLKYYEHKETPGLGGEIVNPQWIAKWPGRTALNDQYEPIIKLSKTGVKNDNEIDALSGATMTSRGVENMMAYWLGKDGFGPFLKNIRGGKHGV
ncbi:Na(+)-translocating NADH-quinone reductase subunit C [Pleionea sp. CnH1-48]|uniref:Na(+)-translocating NADH-quinone reductase subunit C n=1 Tax=Pleionea sp. CnH1-48 TaxID=2954494 RepID=UPI0020976D09|nr:Na(+)-translocating NADH-quinone reductase subunit C [Pleionea sp. CnH1-48]MCO7225076.1 Na(+)-translocating NADH-quinone reductase subunit C [Pleionea sp. CnH1-48]